MIFQGKKQRCFFNLFCIAQILGQGSSQHTVRKSPGFCQVSPGTLRSAPAFKTPKWQKGTGTKANTKTKFHYFCCLFPGQILQPLRILLFICTAQFSISIPSTTCRVSHTERSEVKQGIDIWTLSNTRSSVTFRIFFQVKCVITNRFLLRKRK